jgi:hypothetical protein
MAITGEKMPWEKKRFFDNDATTLQTLTSEDANKYLVQCITRIVRDCPPVLPWTSLFRGQVYRGLFIGPTSIAYSFFLLSKQHADLQVEGKIPAEWCKAYLELGQDEVPEMLDAVHGNDHSCGVANEFLASNSLKACLYQDKSYALKVIDALKKSKSDKTYSEWLKGRAGALYMLRMIRRWLPEMGSAIDKVTKILIEDIMYQQPWVWAERKYLGPVHGDIGIVTQVVLSDPNYAPQLEDKLLSLLKLQDAEGNWPPIEGKEIGLIQFCHGAPGMIISLLAIRAYFPNLHAQIDSAIALGRKITWERGLLIKEPSICHGISGNALVLEKGQKDHFLTLATPEKIREGLEKGVHNGGFEKETNKEIGEPFGLLWGEAGRAWVWMSWLDGIEDKLVLYTDV